MAQLTTLVELKQCISVLASVEETGARSVSAYLNRAEGMSVGQLRRPIANGSAQVDDCAVYVGLVAASKAGAGP